MTNQEHFNRSVSVLVKAFFEGTLEGGSCAACACGNLIAAANSLTIIPASEASRLGKGKYMWAEMALLVERQQTMGRDPHSIWDGRTVFPNPSGMIAATGYSREHLRDIEEAFMAWGSGFTMEFGSNLDGLLRVVDVLANIHGIDLATAEASKLLFVKG